LPAFVPAFNYTIKNLLPEDLKSSIFLSFNCKGGLYLFIFHQEMFFSFKNDSGIWL